VFPPGEVIIHTAKRPGSEVVDSAFPQRILRRWIWNRRVLVNPLGLFWCVYFLGGLARTLRRLRPELLHVGGPIPFGLLVSLLRPLHRVPSILFVVGEELGAFGRNRAKRLVVKRVLRSADLVVAISRYTAASVEGLGIQRQHIHIIHPCVDSERFSPELDPSELRRSLGLQGHRVLLTVGRLEPRKGHDVVLNALPALRKTFPDLVYVIVGDGAEERRLRNLATSLGVHQAVRFVGRVSDEALPAFYALADLFVMPNREEMSGSVEGFGMVFLEASASGRAVVGGRSGGALDAVRDGETGFLVDHPEDPEAVGEAIASLLQDPDALRRMGEQGRKFAVEQFDWSQSASRLRELSLALLERSNRR
jgi:phosphatidylinositol alpha-1,6-mannosyltransferase